MDLEVDLCGKLKLTGRSSVANRSAGRRNIAEARTSWCRRQVRITEVRLVEDVESVHPQDKGYIFSNPCGLLQRHIGVREARSGQGVSLHRAKAKRRSIEHTARGWRRACRSNDIRNAEVG